MLISYIVSVAAAVTVMISPTPVKAEAAQKRTTTTWAAPVDRVRIDQDAQVVSTTDAGSREAYVLTVDEQRALKRALFQSVRFLD